MKFILSNKCYQIMNKLKYGYRLVMLLACVVTTAAVFFFSNKLAQSNYFLLNQQTEQLSRVVIRQAAQTAYEAIDSENMQALEQLVKSLEQEDFIFDVTIYGQEGNYLIGSAIRLSVPELTGLNQQPPITSIGRVQLVEPVYQGNNFVGFIRLTLNQSQIINQAAIQLNSNADRMHALLITAFIAGLLLALSLSNQLVLWFSPFIPSWSSALNERQTNQDQG